MIATKCSKFAACHNESAGGHLCIEVFRQLVQKLECVQIILSLHAIKVTFPYNDDKVMEISQEMVNSTIMRVPESCCKGDASNKVSHHKFDQLTIIPADLHSDM